MPEPEYHAAYEIYFLISGKKRYIVRGEIVDFTAPAAIFLRPGVPHIALSPDNTPHEMAVVAFKEDIFGRYADLVSRTILRAEDAALLFAVSPQLCRECTEDLPRLAQNRSDLGEAVFAARLFSILCELSALQPLHRIAGSGDAGEEKTVISIVQDLEAHPDERQLLSATAARFGYTPDGLSRLLCRATGGSWKTLRGDIRFSEALRALLFSDRSVEDIALSCGFGSGNYLGDVMRRRIGISPLAYRRRFRGSVTGYDPLPLFGNRY